MVLAVGLALAWSGVMAGEQKTGKTPATVHPVVRWLPYNQRLQSRDEATIERVVIHCTELPDLATARQYGERIHYADSATGNSGHYYIDRDGHIEQWVSLDRVANHTHGFNTRSLGIELVNRGRFPDWLDSRHQTMEEPYPRAQIQALQQLLRSLREQLPGLVHIAGHEDLDQRMVPASDNAALAVHRKRDPGPLFPWDEILAEGGWSSP